MTTCNKDKLIIALDLPNIEQAQELVKKLGDAVSFYKIGLALLPLGGFALAKQLKELQPQMICEIIKNGSHASFFDHPQEVLNMINRFISAQIE